MPKKQKKNGLWSVFLVAPIDGNSLGRMDALLTLSTTASSSAPPQQLARPGLVVASTSPPIGGPAPGSETIARAVVFVGHNMRYALDPCYDGVVDSGSTLRPNYSSLIGLPKSATT